MGIPRIYHGVDIVEIERIAQAIARWREQFLQRVFTERELADSSGRTPSLAVRFAAKEAAAKALGVGLRGIGAQRVGDGDTAVGWREIEVVRMPGGRPSLKLYGRAAERARELKWRSATLSLSHARTAAVASVVALGEPLVVEDEGGADDALW